MTSGEREVGAQEKSGARVRDPEEELKDVKEELFKVKEELKEEKKEKADLVTQKVSFCPCI